MEHGEFRIGASFWTATGEWRCTDIGTRVIVAIKLGPREIVRIDDNGQRTTVIDDDPSWLNGPPYAVAESVFDEYDVGGCYPSEAARLANMED